MKDLNVPPLIFFTFVNRKRQTSSSSQSHGSSKQTFLLHQASSFLNTPAHSIQTTNWTQNFRSQPAMPMEVSWSSGKVTMILLSLLSTSTPADFSPWFSAHLATPQLSMLVSTYQQVVWTTNLLRSFPNLKLFLMIYLKSILTHLSSFGATPMLQ